MVIGRIITNDKKLRVLDFVEKVNVIAKYDDKIPTLIIGKDIAEELYGKENIKVLNKQINDYTYWTFSKSERRVEFEKDLEKFNMMLFNKLSKSIKYHFFDVITAPLSSIKSFISFLKNDAPKTCYITKQHIYISHKKWVFGVSLDTLIYLGISKDKIINKIKQIKSIRLITEEHYFSTEMNKYIKGNKILLAYLL